MKNARQMPQKKFRYPQELLELIDSSAEFYNRSANAEVVYQLEKAYGLKKERSADV